MEYKVFGCKVNKYYTDKWLNSDYLSGKWGIFIASCVVTDSAKRKWIKFVKDTSQEIASDEKIYISGCGAFKDGRAQSDFFDLYPELEKYRDTIEVLWEDPEGSSQNPPPNLPLIKGEEQNNPHNTGGSGKSIIAKPKIKIPDALKSQIYTKKFVLIQWGCDSFCSFCLTVVKRGRHFFRSAEEIAEEIEDFVKTWGKEAVLTGVNLSAWGLKTTNDIKNSRFAELLQYILDNTTIQRLRISSLGPEFIGDDCLEIFKNTRIYPHFHFSAQSGSSAVLKNMRRHYDGPYIKDIMARTKNLTRDDGIDISLWADIIIWFPGETEKNFQETYDFIKEVGIQKLHAFPFSAHEMGESVPAGTFENQVSDKIKKERMKKINELWDHIRVDFINSQKWKTLQVLIEQVEWKSFKWWTQNYIEATEKNFQVMSGSLKRNSIVTGFLTEMRDIP